MTNIGIIYQGTISQDYYFLQVFVERVREFEQTSLLPLIALGTPALASIVLLVITVPRISELLRDWWHEKLLS